MTENELTTIVLMHLQKINPDLKRKVVYAEVSTLCRHYGIDKAKEMLYKHHGIKEDDLQMTLNNLPFK